MPIVTQQNLDEKGKPHDDDGRGSQLDRPSESRASTDQAATEKIWTAEEILADDELWRVTDSSEDDDSDIDISQTNREGS